MPAHSQGHQKFLAGREARTLLIVWWFVCGIVLFHGLLFAINGAPFALASVFLWILISKMWEEFVTHLRCPNDSRPVWNSAMGVILTAFTMGVFFAFLTWAMSYLMSLAGYVAIGSVPLFVIAIVAGLCVGASKSLVNHAI